MDRPEHRSAEMQERQRFADYDATYRKVYKNADARSIGEGWMRGAGAEASGASVAGMVLYPAGEPAPLRDASDVAVSAAYGSLRFQARFRVEHLPLLERQWSNFIEAAREDPVAKALLSGDARS